MKVLITGATGFIGRKIVETLKAENIEILVLIRTSASEYKIANPELHVIESSIENISEDKLLDLKIDTIIHFAWANVSKVMLESHITEELASQKQFLLKAMNCGVKKIIISGSCFEYGKINGALDVNKIIPEPNTCYGIAKNNLRIWLEDYVKEMPDIAVAWMRIFYAYGEGQHERSLYAQLIKSIENDEKTFNMSRGFQIRDFISVDEIALAVLNNLMNLKPGFKLLNICSGNPVSVRELVEDILRKNNAEMQLNLGFYPIPDYEPLAFWGVK